MAGLLFGTMVNTRERILNALYEGLNWK